ncbi:MAG: lysophospholipid acyltransferase family protein [Planctomycetota bacterium]
MQLEHFLQPYEFIPPKPGTFWCWLFSFQVVPRLQRTYGVHEHEFRGLDHLKDSLRRNAGILLAPNHCRYADPPVLGLLSLEAKQYFYYAASWHLFMQKRFHRWVFPRVGVYSVFREGADRDMVRETVRILEEAERPVVMYPEGTFYRQNDKLGPFQEGVTFIARRAASKAKRPILIHPVAIKYWFTEDPRQAIAERLDRLEKHFFWEPENRGNALERVLRIITGYMAVREVEYLGRNLSDGLERRITHLTDQLLTRLEKQVLGQEKSGVAMERLRIVRQAVVRELRGTVSGSAEQAQVLRTLRDTGICQQIISQDVPYLLDNPSEERLAETIQRHEEDLLGFEKPIAKMGVVVEILPALNVADFPEGRRGEEGAFNGLTARIGKDIQSAIDRMILEGPPRQWQSAHAWRSQLPPNKPADSPDRSRPTSPEGSQPSVLK